jgi:hypothetical protein
MTAGACHFTVDERRQLAALFGRPHHEQVVG